MTGQLLGRCSKTRSLYCLTRVAILNRVSMMVLGSAVARLVPCSARQRNCGCKTSAAAVRNKRAELARKDDAEVRSDFRSLFTGLIKFST